MFRVIHIKSNQDVSGTKVTHEQGLPPHHAPPPPRLVPNRQPHRPHFRLTRTCQKVLLAPHINNNAHTTHSIQSQQHTHASLLFSSYPAAARSTPQHNTAPLPCSLVAATRDNTLGWVQAGRRVHACMYACELAVWSGLFFSLTERLHGGVGCGGKNRME